MNIKGHLFILRDMRHNIRDYLFIIGNSMPNIKDHLFVLSGLGHNIRGSYFTNGLLQNCSLIFRKFMATWLMFGTR